MSAVAEMVGNYAEIKRRFRNLKAPVKAPEPMPEPQISPVVNLWTKHIEEFLEVDHAFGPVVCPEPREAIRVEDVIKESCRHFKISRTDVLSDRRTAEVVYPRHLAMYVARTVTLRSLPCIGGKFGRDHTSILSAVRKITALVALGEAAVLSDVQAIKKALGVADD